MLTKLRIKNFKRFDAAEIDLRQSVVFIGPNNSGKTTALQALALWEAGCKQWLAKRPAASGRKDSAKAITIGRKDLVYVPLPSSNALWKDLKVREGYREEDKTKTRNIHIDIIVDGVDRHGNAWSCGFEFEFASEEYFYCRPLRLDNADKPARMPVPTTELAEITLAFLPPISGLLMDEALLQPGRVEVLLGNGRSGEVLRNLCYSVFERSKDDWRSIVGHMQMLFGITLNDPVFISQLGTLEVDYTAQEGKTRLPLTSAGLGMLQTLHLLVYLYLKPGAVLMLDEPDAHLEILRQRQTYHLLTEIARRHGSQVASHSEVVLNEAVERDTVIAFVGKPHVVSGRQGSQVLKALRDFGFEHYIQAEISGWVLYLEGSTDLAILQAWAKVLNHSAQSALKKPFVHYLNSNVPSQARVHFNAVREANADLIGLALFDRLDISPQGQQFGLTDLQWQRREIENYFASPEVLLNFARGNSPDDLIEMAESQRRQDAMQDAIAEIEQALKTLGEDLWSPDRKASEQVLPQILKRYSDKVQDIRVPEKGSYYTLIEHQHPNDIAPEVISVLDSIHDVASRAKSHDHP
jgi:predicted ATPase